MSDFIPQLSVSSPLQSLTLTHHMGIKRQSTNQCARRWTSGLISLLQSNQCSPRTGPVPAVVFHTRPSGSVEAGPHASVAVIILSHIDQKAKVLVVFLQACCKVSRPC